MTSPYEAHLDSPQRKISIPEGLITHEIKRETVDQITATLLQEVADHYGKEGIDPLSFHAPEHSMYVGQKAIELYQTIREAAGDFGEDTVESDVCAIAIAASGHDLYVDTKPHEFTEVNGVRVRNGNRQRLRNWIEDADAVQPGMHRGNEFKSAEGTVSELRKHDYEGDLFGKDMPAKLRYGVKVTLPDIDPKFELPQAYRSVSGATGRAIDLSPYLDNGTSVFRIFQKYNTPTTPLTAFCIGVADLSYVGALQPEKSIPIADAEYRELHIGIIDRLEKVGLKHLHLEEKKEMVTSMLRWMKSQVQFGITQKYNFDTVLEQNLEIKNHPKADDIKKALRAEHGHFDDFVSAQVNRYEQFVHRSYKGTEMEQVDEQIGELASALGISIKES